jgi:hypothetical protein
MKKVNEILDPSEKKKGALSKKMQARFREWAIAAHKMDDSQPASYYYNLFLKRLREKYYESKQKDKFYDAGIIEV